MTWLTSGFRATLARVQWRRGARAGLAVGSVMVACHLLGKSSGWAALGALQVLTVDNGGPYRSRLANIATVIFAGGGAVLLGTLAPASLPVGIVITALFCFAVTLSRVMSQPFAASNVLVLVCYIVAYGGAEHTSAYGLACMISFIVGAAWASGFALLLWPVDPFDPARQAVADLYARLRELAAIIETPPGPTELARSKNNELVHQIRLLIEAAQAALAATPARMTARTIRARNLASLVQAADLLFARVLRLNDLRPDAAAAGPEAHAQITALSTWLLQSLQPIEAALRTRPADDAAAFTTEGSRSTNMHRGARLYEALPSDTRNPLEAQIEAQLIAIERDCLLSLEVAYEALRAIWTGSEPRATRTAALRLNLSADAGTPASTPMWLDALRANLTPRSLIFRHALRLAAVTSLDVWLLHLTHITHSYWLPMTSIIVLQPYTGETWRRSGDRVGGTVAGAILAAVLAAGISSEAGIIAVIAIGCFFTLAVYAADYAWYCFFLTPTVVLMTLPHLRDWHFAAVRMGMTGVGAAIALLAMLLFWPERESLQLPGLLARAATADAAYLRAMLRFWQCPAGDLHARTIAERTVLAPARRACGLATNDAEESLDRALLEHSIPLHSRPAHERLNHDALTFTAYLRRLTQAITTFAAIGSGAEEVTTTITDLAARLDTVALQLVNCTDASDQPLPEIALDAQQGLSLADQLLTRIARQVGVLERATADITSAGARTTPA